MTAEELAAMIAAVQASFSEEASIYIYPGDVQTTFNLLQRQLVLQNGEGYLLFVVEHGPAEIFCLSGFNQSPIVLSDRYIALCHRLRTILGPPFNPASIALLSFESLLGAVAELALAHGQEDFAVAMFLKSLENQRTFLGPAPSFSEIGNNPMNESGIVMMFFGLLHEIGHAYISRKINPAQALQRATRYAELVAVLIDTDPNSTNEQKARYRQLSQTAGSVLSPKSAGEEAVADAFATRVLYAAAPHLLLATGVPRIDWFGLAIEMVVAFRVICAIEFCRVVAELSAANEFTAQEVMEKWAPFWLAFSLRQKHIVATLVSELTKRYADDYPGEAELQVSSRMTRLLEKLSPRFDAIDRCIEKVASTASAVSKRNSYKRILDELPADGSVLETMKLDTIRAFLEVAATVGASGEAISSLRRLLGNDPQKWSTGKMAKYFAETKLPKGKARSINEIAHLLKPANICLGR